MTSPRPHRLPRSIAIGQFASVAFASTLLAVAFVAETASAQGNSYAAPIGGRSALMGNTGIALGVDGAAPFLNPATIVRLDDQRFAFSVNFYSYSLSHFSNWHQPGPVDSKEFGNVGLSGTSLSSTGFSVLPSTLCLFFTLAKGSQDPAAVMANLNTWRQKLAICLGTTESQGVAFTALPFQGKTGLGFTTQAQSLVQSWSRLHAGPTYTVAVSRRLAFGLSLHGVYSGESYILDSNSITTSVKNGGVQSALGLAGSGHSLDLSAILGAIYSAAPFTFGASITLPGAHIMGSYTASMNEEYASGSSGTAAISNATGSFDAAPPVRFALGAGVQWPRLTLEIDEAINIPSPAGFSSALGGSTSTLTGTSLTNKSFVTTYSVQEHTVADTSVGAEYFWKKDFSIVGGASINLSALPGLAPTTSVGNLVQEKESFATLSAGVGNYSKNGNLLIGFQFGYGWGSSLAVNPYVSPNQLAVIDTQSYSALLILAGSTSLSSLGDAAVRIEHVITGVPLQPAKPSATKTPTAESSDRPLEEPSPSHPVKLEEASPPEEKPAPKPEEKPHGPKPDERVHAPKPEEKPHGSKPDEKPRAPKPDESSAPKPPSPNPEKTPTKPEPAPPKSPPMDAGSPSSAG